MEELILYIVKSIVSNPDAVSVEEGGMREEAVIYNLKVADDCLLYTSHILIIPVNTKRQNHCRCTSIKKPALLYHTTQKEYN